MRKQETNLQLLSKGQSKFGSGRGEPVCRGMGARSRTSAPIGEPLSFPEPPLSQIKSSAN